MIINMFESLVLMLAIWSSCSTLLKVFADAFNGNIVKGKDFMHPSIWIALFYLLTTL